MDKLKEIKGYKRNKTVIKIIVKKGVIYGYSKPTTYSNTSSCRKNI